MMDSMTNDRQRYAIRRDLEEEKEDSSPPQTEEQQQPIEEGAKIEDILLYLSKTPPNTQRKESEIQKDNSTMASAENSTADATDTNGKTSSMEIPPRPLANANNTSSAGAQNLEDSHLEVIFPTATPITKIPSSKEIKDDNNNKEVEPKGPPYPVTNATLTDLAHQEIENWLGDGPDLSWTDEDNDEFGSKQIIDNDEPSEMDIVVPATEEEEDLIDELIEDWEEEHGKPKPNNNETSVEEENQQQQQEESNDKGNPTPTNNVKTTPPPTPGMTLSPLEPVAAPVVIEPTSILPPSSLTMAPDVVVSPTPSPIVTKKTNIPTRTNPTPRTLVPTMAPTTTVEPCHYLGMHTVAHFSCETGFPSIMVYVFFAFFPLLLICCCWKYCCGGSSKGRDVQGEYRAVANTYGDANFDNAFSDNFSDDEDEDFGFISSNRNDNNNNNGDVEESWGKSGGKRVLEMSNLGTKDDLSLEEMNG
jgi:hypothetical protein